MPLPVEPLAPRERLRGTVINESAARELFAGGPAVGRGFTHGKPDSQPWTVLGVGGALLATRGIESFLFETAPTEMRDPEGTVEPFTVAPCVFAPGSSSTKPTYPSGTLRNTAVNWMVIARILCMGSYRDAPPPFVIRTGRMTKRDMVVVRYRLVLPGEEER